MKNGKTDARKIAPRDPWAGRTFGDVVAEMEGPPRKRVPPSDPQERIIYDTALTFLDQARLALEAGDKAAATDAALTAAECCSSEPWSRAARRPQKRTRRAARAARKRRRAR
jgi:hypothetical protein